MYVCLYVKKEINTSIQQWHIKLIKMTLKTFMTPKTRTMAADNAAFPSLENIY